MNKRDLHDVVIVGAGPGGSAAAHYLARHGLDVLLLDKAEFPRDKTCGDGLTPRALSILEDMGLFETLNREGFPIKGIELIAPRGHSFRVDIPTARIENPEGTPIEGYSGHMVANLAADDSRIYIGLSNHDVVALDRSDFSVEWTLPTSHGVWSAPLLLDGVLYFTSLDHNLYAADTATGDVLWKLDLEGAALSTPVVANNRLYVGSFARKLFAVSLDGEILDEYQTVDWVWGSPTIVDDVLYAADLGGTVYALDISGGMTELWKTDVAAKAIRPSPLVVGSTVVVASSDMKIYWLSADSGLVNFSRQLESPVFADLLLIEPSETLDIPQPLIVVSTMSAAEALVAFTLDQGERRWVYALQ